MNMRFLHSASKAQDKEDSPETMVCRILMFVYHVLYTTYHILSIFYIYKYNVYIYICILYVPYSHPCVEAAFWARHEAVGGPGQLPTKRQDAILSTLDGRSYTLPDKCHVGGQQTT